MVLPYLLCSKYNCATITFSPAPSVSVQVRDGGATPTAGENYQLTCSIAGAGNLNPASTYLWMKNSGSGQTQVGTNSNTLFFTPLLLSDAANYVCTVTIASSYLTGNIVVMNAQDIRIQSGSNFSFFSMSLICALSYSSNSIFYYIDK